MKLYVAGFVRKWGRFSKAYFLKKLCQNYPPDCCKRYFRPCFSFFMYTFLIMEMGGYFYTHVKKRDLFLINRGLFLTAVLGMFRVSITGYLCGVA